MEEIKNNIPLISAFLLILGAANLLVYYGYFGIDIMSYLDFSEVIQLQFKVFAIAAAFIVANALYMYLCPKFVGPDSDRVIEIRKNREEEYRKARALKKTEGKPETKGFFSKISGWYLWLPFILFYAYELQANNTYTDLFIFGLIPIWTVLVIIAYFEFRKGIVSEEEFNEDATIEERREQVQKAIKDRTPEQNSLLSSGKVFCLIIIITFASVNLIFLRARYVVSNTSLQEVTAFMEKDTLITNENYRYVGQTKGHIFFYDKKKEQAEVYATSDVKKLLIREGINYKEKGKAEPKPLKFPKT
ncbi:MAG: hypothetical protein EOP45_05805, partial [Sphingobacteriaceae bacterium]